MQTSSAKPWIPEKASLRGLMLAAQRCEGCDLYRHATQTVFGEGLAHAKVVVIGEQPGDREDLEGRPFCGPAGQLLDRALEDAGIDRKLVYVTNAVKHFKFEERGKRRIHKKPNSGEVAACRPWLQAEIATLKPDLIVCLGATAAQSLAGREFRVLTERGKFLPHAWAAHLMATIHPSALLRLPDKTQFDREYKLFVQDLTRVTEYLKGKFA